MTLIVPKEVLLDAYKNMAEKKMMDKDFLLVKLQEKVDDGDFTQAEIQPIVDILNPPEAT